MEWNDIVDWPPRERDGYVRTEVNTVVNAFHLAAIEKMAGTRCCCRRRGRCSVLQRTR